MLEMKRRDFLKLMAISSAIFALSSSELKLIALKEKKENKEDDRANISKLERRYLMCSICEGHCVLVGSMLNGKLAKIEGDSRDWVSHGRPCVKGKTSHLILYDPDRLKAPLKRTNSDRGFILDKNGAIIDMKDPKWVEISWDEALDIVASKIAEAIKTWGPQSVVFIGHGRGADLASLIGTPNVVKHHTTCHSTWDVSLRPAFGGKLPVADLANAKLIISFGYDQGAGKSRNPAAWSFAEAIRKGTEVIVFEPRLSETANKATEWIPIKPGTDLAVTLAMANVILNEGLYDKNFLIKYTNAPIIVDQSTLRYIKNEKGQLLVYDEFFREVKPIDEAVRPALFWRGKIDNKNAITVLQAIRDYIKGYTPQWAEKISEVSASKIIEIARKFAIIKPACIGHWKRSGGTGPSRAQGVETYKVLTLLMALTGNIEKFGGWIINKNAKFIKKAVSKKAHKSFAELYPIPKKYQGKTVDEKEKFPLYYKMLKEGAYQKVWYNILNDKPYPIKVLIIWGQGLQATIDYEIVEKAIKHVSDDNKGLVVNINIYPDGMAVLADVVLPEKMFLEGGPSVGYSESFDMTHRINWIEGIPPIYPGVKSMEWIATQLAYRIAEKLGISKDTLEKEYLPESMLLSSEEKIEKELSLYNSKLGTSLTPEELEKVKVYSVKWEPTNLTRLATESGRIEILSMEVLKYGYNPLPVWKNSFTYKGPLAKNELAIISSVFAMNRHSKTVNNPWLRYFLKKHNADKIWLHPIIADRLGLKEEDFVVIEYSRSFGPQPVTKPSFNLLARVHITEAIRPDSILIPHGTGQLSKFMSSYKFGTYGGDGTTKPIFINYEDPSASAHDQDFIVKIIKIR